MARRARGAAAGEAGQQASAADRESPQGSTRPSAEEVARRAYEIYRERGGEDGHDQDDWLRAERELGEGDTLVPARLR